MMYLCIWLENVCSKQTWQIDWEAKKTLDISEFNSKNIKLAYFTGLFFISLPLLKLLENAFAPVHD